MKNKNRIFTFFLSLTVFLLFFSCGGPKAEPKPEWKGTIEEVNGVTVVTNPDEPLYGELVFDLEEDLSIGREDDDNYMFFRIIDIKVDGDGNIYVFERGNIRVQKFDRNGNFLCTIGRQGQGPGEYQRPIELLLADKRGIIGVKDMMKLVVFDKDGHYLDKDIPFEKYYHDLVIDSSGILWGYCFDREGDDEATADLYKALVKINDKGQIAETFDRFSFDLYQERLEGGATLSIGTGEEYDLHLSLLGEQNVIYGYSKEYELNVIDLEGKLQTKIKKEEPYQSFSVEERQKHKRGNVPEYKPFFYSIFTDSEDRIYAQKTSAIRIKDVEKTFDVFSKDGYYLYRTVCPLTPFAIKDGFFYTRVENEDTGEVFVKRFRIKNWDKIKTGI
ncbi:MAG: 6-bladed beta-propeller [Candidatus Aminicenantes bacterium]